MIAHFDGGHKVRCHMGVVEMFGSEDVVPGDHAGRVNLKTPAQAELGLGTRELVLGPASRLKPLSIDLAVELRLGFGVYFGPRGNPRPLVPIFPED
jgi:hypothetical protein